MIIDQSMLSPEGDDIGEIFNIIINYIIQIGKPITVLVRDQYIMYSLKDLCERTNIELKIKGKLKTIDYFVEEFANFRF